VLGPDAGVEDADDDALARLRLPAQALPQHGCADEAGGHIGLRLLDTVGQHGRDASGADEAGHLLGSYEHRDAAEDEVVPSDDLGARCLRLGRLLEGGLLLLDVGEVRAACPRRGVEGPACGSGARGREALEVSVVADHRLVIELDS
jgi:hypothetical protein